MLVQQLDSCADLVKITKESHRLNTLLHELEPIHFSLKSDPTSLPISPSIQVKTNLPFLGTFSEVFNAFLKKFKLEIVVCVFFLNYLKIKIKK